ncbi:uncharacterized protein LOC126295500 [Schistocerca gregaria]|uniref:uncharacterized protein LOC126295500 n=1 Tax=Schistocerca gregaria TaxID=7010 RepID=UPI00211E227D|nr:uncharacterized protein LOC126295500 [Schistocerca gregaria]
MLSRTKTHVKNETKHIEDEVTKLRDNVVPCLAIDANVLSGNDKTAKTMANDTDRTPIVESPISNQNYNVPLSFPPHEQYYSTTPRVPNDINHINTVMPTGMANDMFVRHWYFQTFSSEDKHKVHPTVFIRSFDGVFPRSWSEVDKIRHGTNLMRGRAAKWGAAMKRRCLTFEQFKQAFLDEFWSENEQQSLRREGCNPETYDPKKETLRQYFERYLDKTLYWSKPADLPAIIDTLKSHLHFPYRGKLIGVADNDVKTFLNFLDQMDVVYRGDSRHSDLAHIRNQNQHPPQRNHSDGGWWNHPSAPRHNTMPARETYSNGNVYDGRNNRRNSWNNNNNNNYHPYQNGNYKQNENYRQYNNCNRRRETNRYNPGYFDTNMPCNRHNYHQNNNTQNSHMTNHKPSRNSPPFPQCTHALPATK